MSVILEASHLIAFSTWPGEGCEEANFGFCRYPAQIEVVDDHGHTDYAHVSKSRPHSLQELSGTDVQKALQKAGMLSDLPGSGESDVRKYILFDFDAGDLATTNVYDSYREAADDASELDNVIVVPLVFEKETADTA